MAYNEKYGGWQNMVGYIRFVLQVVLFILGALSLWKSVNLYLTYKYAHERVDGSGIGVSFLGFEIDDRVPTAEIPYFAGRYLAAGVVLFGLLLISWLTARRSPSL